MILINIVQFGTLSSVFEIIRVTNAIEEAVEVEQNEVVGVVVFDDGKVACERDF
jgi:hypothetical protein